MKKLIKHSYEFINDIPPGIDNTVFGAVLLITSLGISALQIKFLFLSVIFVTKIATLLYIIPIIFSNLEYIGYGDPENFEKSNIQKYTDTIIFMIILSDTFIFLETLRVLFSGPKKILSIINDFFYKVIVSRIKDSRRD
jgi:hypothetical protein